MPDRYFCEDLQQSVAVLVDSEAHHARHVMRLKAGDRIQLFDGQGTAASGTVIELGRRSVRVEVLETSTIARPDQRPLMIASAVPKGDRLKWMVEKLTELGVDRWQPIVCERSVAEPGKSRLEKLHTTVVHACKQSGRLHLMIIERPLEFQQFLQQSSSTARQLLMAHPCAQPFAEITAQPAAASRGVLIGPEGGFTDREVEAAQQAKVQPVALSGHILRTETAAVAFAALHGSWQ